MHTITRSPQVGVERIQATTGGLGHQRVRKRHVQVIRPPRMFVTDVASCAWLCNQLDPEKTVQSRRVLSANDIGE